MISIRNHREICRNRLTFAGWVFLQVASYACPLLIEYK